MSSDGVRMSNCAMISRADSRMARVLMVGKPRGERRLVVAAQGEVLREGEGEEQAVLLAVLGDVRDSRLSPPARTLQREDALALQEDVARRHVGALRRWRGRARTGRCPPRRRCRRSPPPRTSKREPVHRRDSRAGFAPARSRTSRTVCPGCDGGPVHLQEHGLSHHELRDMRLGGPRRGPWSRTTRPWRITVMRSAISSTSSSLWLMKMMPLPCARERAEGPEQLARTSWG